MKGVTPHQFEVLLRLRQLEVKSEALVDLDQLLLELSWKPTKEAAQFVIRALVSKGLIEKMPRELRRGRTRACFSTTESGKLALDPTREGKPLKVSSGDVKSVVPGIVEESSSFDVEFDSTFLLNF